MRRALLLFLLLPLASARPAGAWPSETMQALSRDARKLLPRSLARLLGERESQVLEELRHFPPELARALAQEQPAGRLRPETLQALEGQADRAVSLLKAGRVNEGLVALGGLMRIPADLSDPVLAVGPEGWPAGLTREYYALFAANLTRMPVVLDDPASLKLSRQQLSALWQSLLDRSRPQVAVLRGELFKDGRVVDHRRLDYRSPAWAVASLAYSRAVTGTAASWLVVWREARGDTTHMPRGREVAPQPQPEVP